MFTKVQPKEFKSWQKANPTCLLIDVREEYEFQDDNLGGVNMPLEEVINHLDEFPKDAPILFCCKSGKRSAAIAYTLSRKYGRQNIYSLEGGIEALHSLQ